MQIGYKLSSECVSMLCADPNARILVVYAYNPMINQVKLLNPRILMWEYKLLAQS